MNLHKEEEIMQAERERIIRIIDRLKIKCGENIYMVSVKDLKQEIKK